MANNQPSETNLFLRKVWSAILRLGALALFGLIHYLLNHGLEYITPKGMDEVRQLTEDVIFCMFMGLYIFLAWDMLKVFIPRLGGQTAIDAVVVADGDSNE